MTPVRTKRGRPRKFDRPSRVVALTLPVDVIAGLCKVDGDLAWAVVRMFEKRAGRKSVRPERPLDAELVAIPDHRSLIVVNRSALKYLPGINVIPLNGDRAFLALDPGHGVRDLELAVIDRLEQGVSDVGEQKVLNGLRARLAQWRRDPTLVFEERVIVVGRRVRRRARRRPKR